MEKVRISYFPFRQLIYLAVRSPLMLVENDTPDEFDVIVPLSLQVFLDSFVKVYVPFTEEETLPYPGTYCEEVPDNLME